MRSRGKKSAFQAEDTASNGEVDDPNPELQVPAAQESVEKPDAPAAEPTPFGVSGLSEPSKSVTYTPQDF
jgi:hypothetical protein